MTVKFTVLGQPVGKGRPRFSRRGPNVVTFTPEETVNYETLIRTEYRLQCGNTKFSDDAMLDMRVFAFYAIPASKSKKKQAAMLSGAIRPAKVPDADNILKAASDALNGIAYKDDRQIVDAQVRKFYSRNPRLEVTIQRI